MLDWLAFSGCREMRVIAPGRAGTWSSVEFFDNLSRFGGVSEAMAECKPTDEILSEAEGS
jgi:hypothetical protein